MQKSSPECYHVISSSRGEETPEMQDWLNMQLTMQFTRLADKKVQSQNHPCPEHKIPPRSVHTTSTWCPKAPLSSLLTFHFILMRVVSLPFLRLSRYIPDSSLYSCYSQFLERRFPKFYTIPSFIPTATRRRSRSIFSESPLASLYKTEVFSHQQAFTISLLLSTIFSIYFWSLEIA